VKITATSGKEKSYQEIELNVRNPNPYVTDVLEAIVDAKQSKPFSFSAVGMKGTNKGILEVSNIPPINLGQRLEYLIRYPHGCIEQTTSSGFPQLYVSRLLKTDESMNERIQTNISATLDRLRNFQVSSGGFAYWPGDSDESHWGSNYAGHFILEAKELGYSVSATMLKNWVKFQRKTARGWSPNTNSNSYYYENDHLMQAYRLYTLALAGEAELGAMNRLREMKNLSIGAKWRLAGAYAAIGKTDVAKKIINNLSTNVKPYTELSYTYGSGLRDKAMILETLTLIKDRTKAGKVVLEISKDLSKGDWYSTQSVAYGLLAVGKYVGLNKMDGEFKFAYNVGKGSVNAGSNTPIVQIPIEIDKGVKQASIKNTGNSILYARVILSGQPTIGDNTVASNDLKIAINYTDMKGQKLDPSRLPQGTDFVAEVTVTHPGIRRRYDEMALTQIFPSGWEIYNTRLNKVQTFSNTHTPEYQDIKDDRVYTYFDIRKNKSHIYRIQLNASYQGRYYLPTVECSAMYDNTISARQPGQWVEVVSSGGQAN
jgi:uncharacterized protein YfaS (alpha-2-macroglobulin family)